MPGAVGDFCTGKVDRNFQSGYLDHGALSVGLEIDPDDVHERCRTAEGDMVVGVGRNGELWADQELDVELVVGYRKADAGTHGAAADPGAAPELPAAEATELAGGSSFSTVTELQPGQAIRDDVRGQESRYFKMPVALGQGLQMKAHFGSSPKTSAVAVTAFNPLREQLGFGGSAHTHGNGWMSAVYSDLASGDGGVTMQAPLEWALLPENVLGANLQHAHSVGGMQYLVVSRAWHDGGDSSVGFTLQTGVWGEAAAAEGAGAIVTAEDYAAEFGPEEPSPSPSPTPSEEPSAEASEVPTGEPSESVAPTDDPTEGTEATPEPTSNGWLVPALGGAGALCLVGGGAWWWLRRR